MARHFNRVAVWILGGASWLLAAGLVWAGETAPTAKDQPAPAKSAKSEPVEKPARCELHVGKTYQLVVRANGTQRKLRGEVTRIEGDTIELTEKTGQVCVKIGVPYLSQLPYLSELFSTKIGTQSFRTDDVMLDQILSSSEIDDEADSQDKPPAGLPLAPQGIVLSDGVLLPPPPRSRCGLPAPPWSPILVPPVDQSPVFDWKITSTVCEQDACPLTGKPNGPPILPHPVAHHPEAIFAPPVGTYQPTPSCPPTQFPPPGMTFRGVLPPPQCPPTPYPVAICASTDCPASACATTPGPPAQHGVTRQWIKFTGPPQVCVVESCPATCPTSQAVVKAGAPCSKDEQHKVRIPQGYVVVAVKTTATTVAAELIHPGDRVDVTVYVRKNPREGIAESLVTTFLRDITVYAVNRPSDPSSEAHAQTSTTVSLVVTPKQGEKLALAEELGKLRLVLTNPAMDEDFLKAVEPSDLWAEVTAPPSSAAEETSHCGPSCPCARPGKDWPSYHDLVQQSMEAAISEARATARLESLQDSMQNREELMQAVLEAMSENARLQAAAEHHQSQIELLSELLNHKAELAAAQAKLQAQAEFQQHLHHLQEENAVLQRHVAELERLARQRPPQPAIPTVRQAESIEPPQRK